MGDWEAMRACFCVLWFGRTNSSDNSNRSSDDDATNESASFDKMCSSLWGSATTFSPSYANIIEELLYTRVVVVICCFGLLGNAINLVVLSAQRYQTPAGRMQQFARIGLMALAVSDSLFCLSILPHAFVERDPLSTSVSFSLVYSAYGEAVINVFAMTGTWLTVAMATGRYAAVCHPFEARAAIGRTVALRIIAVVSLTCVAFNVPRFFRNTIETCPRWGDERAVGQQVVYFRWHGPLHTFRHRWLELAHVWTYFLVSVVVPLIVLLYAGCRLTCWLRRGRLDDTGAEERAAASVDLGRFQEIDRSFTLTLVAVAVMHIVLVIPAELVYFSRDHLLQRDHTSDGYHVYNLLVSVLNTLQAVNYSFNFLVYCAVNVAFRRRFVELVSCRRRAETENRMRLQLLTQGGMLLEASSVDSEGRRGRRSATAARGGVCRLTLSDPGDAIIHPYACRF